MSRYGIFVIETKNYKGWIYGHENAEKWTQNIYGNKYELYNPIRQNNTHINVLRSALSEFGKLPFVSIIAFSTQASLCVTGTSAHVVYWSQVRKLILKYTEEKVSTADVRRISTTLNTSRIKEKGSRHKHNLDVRATINKKEQALANGRCPRCGSSLIQRHGKYGGFYGCSNYPKCTFTINRKEYC